MLTPLAPADGEAILPLAESKRYLRVLNGAQDDTIGELRDAAIDWLEGAADHALTRRQFLLEDRQFVCRLRLPRRPAASVDEVSYFTTDGTKIELEATAWRFGAGFLEPAHGVPWPYASGREGSVMIKFTAGFESPADIPRLMITAAKAALAAMFANREAPDLRAAERIARRFAHRTL